MRHFPALLKLVDVRRPADEQEPGVPGDAHRRRPEAPSGGADRRSSAGESDPQFGGARLGANARGNRPTAMAHAEEDWIGTVDWNANDINALESRFNWKETPSTLAVVLAQEDLWVIEALLRVITNTNEGTTYATAAVKQIRALQIGKRRGPGGRVKRACFGRFLPAGRPRRNAARRNGPRRSMAAGAGAGSDDQRLIENRYVDEKGKPLPSIPEYPYAKHPYAEFKMMPIRMNLVMDQRRLPKLLVECANSNMPIEVKRVRILKSRGQHAGFRSGGGRHGWAGGPAMGGPRGGGFRGPVRQPGFEGGDRAMRTATDKQESGTFDVPVEIYGVIYIYNPPDREKLGTGAASAEKPAESRPARRTVPAGNRRAQPRRGPARPPVTSDSESRAMKLKLKLDKKTLLDFLLQNVEKIVFGVIVLVFVLMLYSSLSTAGRFDKTPEELQADVAKGRHDIESTPPDPKLEVIDYVSQAKRSRVRIEEKPYVNSVTWDPPLFENRPLRDAPPLFTVQELRGSAGMGAFHTVPAARLEQPEHRTRRNATSARIGPSDSAAGAMPGLMPARAAGGEDIRGQRWIVITGLVPIEKQETAYADTFKQSLGYDPQNDYPMYLGYCGGACGGGQRGRRGPSRLVQGDQVHLEQGHREASQEWSTCSRRRHRRAGVPRKAAGVSLGAAGESCLGRQRSP